jgi:inorganic phosphate transporter, PiT family
MEMGWLWLVIGLAFFLAWNLGANDVANAMGTSVGSKVLTLRQAILLAGVLELAGAILFGQQVTVTLTGKVTHLQVFNEYPHLFVLSVVAELLATCLWIFCATARGWPVASSHAAVGAIAGANAIAFGFNALDGSTLGTITLAWLLTPLASGLVSAGFFAILQYGILDRSEPSERWIHWTPWLSVAVVGLVGGLVLPTAINPLANFLKLHWNWNLPRQDYVLGLGFLGVLALTAWVSQAVNKRTGNSWLFQSGDAPSTRTEVEQQLGKFQIVSACCMAFAHGSNDVGHAVAPLASFAVFWQTQTIPSSVVSVPLWILGLGGIGIVAGLATWGKKVILTVGEDLIALKPSSGFCAELGAATTVLLASSWGLPVSSTHALVGSVVGIGLMQGIGTLKWATVKQVVGAWVVTVPISMALSAGLFVALRSLFPG